MSRSLRPQSRSIRVLTGDLSKPSRSTSFAMSRLVMNSRVPDICWSRPNAPSATTSETLVDGLPRSNRRTWSRRMSFIPAGLRY
jgi:hypothetical protein